MRSVFSGQKTVRARDLNCGLDRDVGSFESDLIAIFDRIFITIASLPLVAA
jgi:hypothetical protein